MSSLFLVRHGESYHNKQGIVCGDLDSPLTELGRQQAKEVAEKLSNFPITNAFTSPLSRTQDTLEIILKERARKPFVEVVPQLKDRHLGDITSRLEKEFSVEQWQEWSMWDTGPKNGESYADVNRRAIPWFEARVKSLLAADRSVLIVSHRPVIKILRQHLENYPKDLVWQLNTPPGGIIHYEVEKGVVTLKSADTTSQPVPLAE